ncbi:hypothetical protein Aglo03_32690 [Actinokineospora globicatena]|uniref:Uncharacterized protein n=1 Tax=Actinokineospora globicatena TaxID=103729 RepID=A0A9W6QL47_9PSEU|nr:hypothetical protein Aglo03_32690 [Actinokineospora globicatena]
MAPPVPVAAMDSPEVHPLRPSTATSAAPTNPTAGPRRLLHAPIADFPSPTSHSNTDNDAGAERIVGSGKCDSCHFSLLSHRIRRAMRPLRSVLKQITRLG